LADADNHNNYQKWQLTSIGTDAGTYDTFEATLVDGSYVFANNHRITLYYLRNVQLSTAELTDTSFDPNNANEGSLFMAWDEQNQEWVRRRITFGQEFDGMWVDNPQEGQVLTYVTDGQGNYFWYNADAQGGGGGGAATQVTFEIKNAQETDTLWPGMIVYADQYNDGAIMVRALDLNAQELPNPEQVLGIVINNSVEAGQYGTALAYGVATNVFNNFNVGANTALFAGKDYPGQIRDFDDTIPGQFMYPIAYTLDNSDPGQQQEARIFVNFFKNQYAPAGGDGGGGSTAAAQIAIEVKNINNNNDTYYPGTLVYVDQYNDGAPCVLALDLNAQTLPDPEQVLGVVINGQIDPGQYGTVLVYGMTTNITNNFNFGQNTALYPATNYPGSIQPEGNETQNTPAEFMFPVAYTLDASNPEQGQEARVFVDMFKSKFYAASGGGGVPAEAVQSNIVARSLFTDKWSSEKWGHSGNDQNNLWEDGVVWWPLPLLNQDSLNSVRIYLTEYNSSQEQIDNGGGDIGFAIYSTGSDGLPSLLLHNLGYITNWDNGITFWGGNGAWFQKDFTAVTLDAGNYFIGVRYEAGTTDPALGKHIKYQGYVDPFYIGNPSQGNGFRGALGITQDATWPTNLSSNQAWDGSDFATLPRIQVKGA
jgi:hypothetical protein